MTRGEPALFGGRCGKGRLSDHVTDRVDMLRLGPKRVVHCEPSTAVGFEPGGPEIEARSGTISADGIEKRVGRDPRAVLKGGTRAPVGVKIDLAHVVPQPESHSAIAHVIFEGVGDLAIEEREQIRPAIYQGYPRSQGGEDAGVLASDDPGADDDHRLGHLIHVENVVAIHHALGFKWYGFGACRVGAHGDHDVVRLELAGRIAVDGEEVWVRESGHTLNQFHSIAPQRVGYDVYLGLDHFGRSLQEVAHGYVGEHAVRLFVERPLVHAGEVRDDLPEGFRRNCVHQYGIAADGIMPVDGYYLLADLGRLDGGALTSGSGADNGEIKFVHRAHFAIVPRHSRRSTESRVCRSLRPRQRGPSRARPQRTPADAAAACSPAW